MQPFPYYEGKGNLYGGYMPAGKDVHPNNWSEIKVLFDNKKFSVIWGYFDVTEKYCLGIRYNGNADYIGYPNLGGNPVWFVIPDELTKMILLDLYTKVAKKPSLGDELSILQVLKECEK